MNDIPFEQLSFCFYLCLQLGFGESSVNEHVSLSTFQMNMQINQSIILTQACGSETHITLFIPFGFLCSAFPLNTIILTFGQCWCQGTGGARLAVLDEVSVGMTTLDGDGGGGYLEWAELRRSSVFSFKRFQLAIKSHAKSRKSSVFYTSGGEPCFSSLNTHSDGEIPGQGVRQIEISAGPFFP